jgi:hypothetical protein
MNPKQATSEFTQITFHILASLSAFAMGSLSATASGQSLAPDILPTAWTGRLCSDTTQPNDKVILAPHELSERPSADHVCVDRARPRVDFQANSLRVISYSWGGAAIKFSCESEAQANEFFQRNKGGQAALVIGNKVLGVYYVARPTMGCGWHQAADVGAAQTQCEAIANAWGTSTDRCKSPCELSSGKGDICIVAK